MPGANSRHEGVTDIACKSPILLRDEIARRNNAFKVKTWLATHLNAQGEPGKGISWAPSEAKPTVSTVLDGGEILSPLHGTEDPS